MIAGTEEYGQYEDKEMTDTGSEITLCLYGAYNSDEHLWIGVTVTGNGYDIVSQADSLWDRNVKGAAGHVPFGFFFRSPQSIIADLKKNGIIPEGLSHLTFHLNPEAAEELYRFDRKHVADNPYKKAQPF